MCHGDRQKRGPSSAVWGTTCDEVRAIASAERKENLELSLLRWSPTAKATQFSVTGRWHGPAKDTLCASFVHMPSSLQCVAEGWQGRRKPGNVSYVSVNMEPSCAVEKPDLVLHNFVCGFSHLFSGPLAEQRHVHQSTFSQSRARY